MKQFTLKLDKNAQRPIVLLEHWYRISALLDTGAVCPVWTKREELLFRLGATKLNKKVPISGFGGTAYGNVYELPELRVGKLKYSKIPIIASIMMDIPFQLILPATLFNDLIYEIDDKNHKLNISIPDDESLDRNLRIKDSNGQLHVLCSSTDKQQTDIPSKIQLFN